MTEPETRPATALVAFRTAILVALTGCAALWAQYASPAEASFCGPGSGCEILRRSPLAYPLGSSVLSTPLLGLGAFAALFAASLLEPRGPRTRALAYAGGAAALGFIAAQAFWFEAWCWLCLVTDLAALTAAALAPLLRGSTPARDPIRAGAWAVLAAIAVVAPPTWARARPAPPLHPAILALYEPGKVNVVEFADFQCPFCRRLHPVLEGLVAERPPGSVALHRRHVPLDSHPLARPAARAAICAEQRGKGEALAQALFAEELSEARIQAAVREVGLDPAEVARCAGEPATEARIAEDRALIEAAGLQGLPTTYVGAKRFVGMASEAALRDALDRAARGEPERGIPAAAFLGVVAALCLATLRLGRLPV